MDVIFEELPKRKIITITTFPDDYHLVPRIEHRRTKSYNTINPLTQVEAWTITFTKMEEGHGRDADNKTPPGTV